MELDSVASCGGGADAALVTFTDRAAWQAAAGGVGDYFENFDSFTIDQSYNPSPVTAGFVTLAVVNVHADFGDPSYRIDAIPAAAGTIPDVNGTTFAVTISNNFGAIFLSSGDTQLSFSPVRAIGFDYAGAAYSTVDGALTTSRGDTVIVAKSDNSNRAFLGLLYTGSENFTSLTWGKTPNGPIDGFGAGIDNIEAFAPVPLPSAVWLSGSTLGGLGFLRRRAN